MRRCVGEVFVLQTQRYVICWVLLRQKGPKDAPKIKKRRLFMKLTSVIGNTKMGLSRLFQLILGYATVRWKSFCITNTAVCHLSGVSAPKRATKRPQSLETTPLHKTDFRHRLD